MEINNQFIDNYTPPELLYASHHTNGRVSAANYLKSRQTVTVSADDIRELAKDPNSWFYESDIELVNNPENVNQTYDYTPNSDMYGMSEYIGVYERYLPNEEYLYHAVTNNLDITMNVYDAHSLYNLKKRNKILRSKIVGNSSLRDNGVVQSSIPSFEFKVPTVVKYSKFVNTKYQFDVSLPAFEKPVQMISINIPYSMYSNQPMLPSVYNWDIDKSEHKFCNLNSEQFNSLLQDICENGITKPLFMRMDIKGILTSVDIETNLILFIASILKLPSIPVTVYMSNEYVYRNDLIEGIINSMNNPDKFNNSAIVNNIFAPYVMINTYSNIISKNINTSFYKSIDNINDIDMLCLNQNEVPELIVKPVENINAVALSMKDEMVKKLSDKINESIKSLSDE